MSIYLICPVRSLEKEEKKMIDAYKKKVRNDGKEIKVPYSDTDQDDDIGLRIVNEHENDILENEVIQVWWKPTSRGSVWDLGQARLAVEIGKDEKKIKFLNKMPDEEKFDFILNHSLIDCQKNVFSFVWEDEDPETLWKFGQYRMLKRFRPEISLEIENLEGLEVDSHKSYKNVCIATCLELDNHLTRDELRKKLAKVKS